MPWRDQPPALHSNYKPRPTWKLLPVTLLMSSSVVAWNTTVRRRPVTAHSPIYCVNKALSLNLSLVSWQVTKHYMDRIYRLARLMRWCGVLKRGVAWDCMGCLGISLQAERTAGEVEDRFVPGAFWRVRRRCPVSRWSAQGQFLAQTSTGSLELAFRLNLPVPSPTLSIVVSFFLSRHFITTCHR